MKHTYMLDTNICSFIMRKKPPDILHTFQAHVDNREEIVISAITYAELRFGAAGKKASPKHDTIVSEFVDRLDHILPYDREAVEKSAELKRHLAEKGTPIGNSDTMIAGHALASHCILVTNNTKEFLRVPGLPVEDWVNV